MKVNVEIYYQDIIHREYGEPDIETICKYQNPFDSLQEAIRWIEYIVDKENLEPGDLEKIIISPLPE